MTMAQHEASATQLLQYDPAELTRCFDREPFYVEHDLRDHPLFAMDRLIELARTIPPDRVEWNVGDLPVAVDPDRTPRNGLSPDETIARIEQCKSWLVLKNVESEPEYRDLLWSCLDAFRDHEPDMHHFEGFIFVSSPHAMTPYHIDPELNFLLQIRGSKVVHLFPAYDRSIISEEELERFYGGAARNLAYRDEYANKAWVRELPAGKGLHFPVTAPHFVQNGDEVSISFSITFRSPRTDRREVLYRINHHLRRFGLRPTPVGQSAWRDGLKYAGFRCAKTLKRVFRPEPKEVLPSRRMMNVRGM